MRAIVGLADADGPSVADIRGSSSGVFLIRMRDAGVAGAFITVRIGDAVRMGAG
jgi:hypothetical protein